MKRIFAAALLAAFAAPALGQWTSWSSTDPIDDSVRKGLASAWTAPRKTMDFPYRKTKAVVGLACDDAKSEAYMRFTEQPNLSRGKSHDGYETRQLRVRFDKDDFWYVHASQSWGSSQFSLTRHAPAGEQSLREAILGANTMLVEIPWHGADNVIFAFSLAGSREAFDAQCGPAIAARKAEMVERVRRAREANREWEERWKIRGDAAAKNVRNAGKHCPSVVRLWRSGTEKVGVACPKESVEGELCFYTIDLLTQETGPYLGASEPGC